MLTIILYVLFTVIALLLITIVLVQEGKGGGFGSAFGGVGTEAFGAGVGGINKFTAYIAAAFMALALFIAWIQ